MIHRIALRCFVAVVSVGNCWSLASAQDRVVIQQPGGSRIPLNGYVEDYTGRELLLRIRPNDPVRRYARSEVVDVATEYTPHHEKARRFFSAGRIDEAKLELATATNEEDRPWVRREILALQVKCALWNGDYQAAISRFLPIVASDAETFHFGLIPLNWTMSEPPANIRFEARDWIANTAKPLSRLIGASWLLTVPDAAADAEQTLKRLARDPDVRIQRQAQMQLWRVKVLRSEAVDPNEIERWDQFIEGLPVEMRGGAYFVIGLDWKQRRENEHAARSFLWLPMVFDADRWLSGRACYEAAESLTRLGDTTQAANLYSEVVFRYGDTPWGGKAETAWKDLQKASRSPNPETKSRTE